MRDWKHVGWKLARNDGCSGEEQCGLVPVVEPNLSKTGGLAIVFGVSVMIRHWKHLAALGECTEPQMLVRVENCGAIPQVHESSLCSSYLTNYEYHVSNGTGANVSNIVSRDL